MADKKTLFRSLALGLLVLVIGFILSKLIQSAQRPPEPKISFQLRKVRVIEAAPQSLPLVLTANGRLKAKNRVELYAEVSGLLENTTFREGATFRRSQTLVSINSGELQSQLRAQRSAFLGLLSQSLPDIAIDYKKDYPAWEKFLNEISVERYLPGLPDIESKTFKQFLSGRGVLNSYYSIKSQEVRLSKFRISAPFSGVLTTANIDPGTLVRPNQLLGVFSQEGNYEAELALDQSVVERLKQGQNVKVTCAELEGEWTGKVSRINSAIDPATQLVSVFIDIRSEELKDGLYITSEIFAGELENVLELDRRLIQQNKYVYSLASDSTLVLKEVKVQSLSDKIATIGGIEKGTLIPTQYIPEAHPGMKVSPVLSE